MSEAQEAPNSREAALTTGWDQTNARRHELIDLKQSRALTDAETAELHELQWLAGLRRELLSGPPPEVTSASPEIEAQAREVVREWAEHDMNEHYSSDYLREDLGSERLEERIASALTAAQARQSELEPHKAINLLTALEHQSYRNHPFRPMECGECGMTARIANALRGQLGLEIRAAKPE